MTRLLFIIFIAMTYSCHSPIPDKEVVLKPKSIPDNSVTDLPIEESIRRQNIFKLYESIKFSRHWINCNKSTDQIDLIISTAPEITLLHDMGDSSVIYKVIDVTEYSDSISIKTTSYNDDITYVWFLKNVAKDKGVWTVFDTKTKKQTIVGTYKSITET